MRLKDKVAIVTGGGIGIGEAISYAFASEGAALVIAARTLSRLDNVAEDIKSRGGMVKVVQTDVSNEKQVQYMVAETLKDYGQIDIFVNKIGKKLALKIYDVENIEIQLTKSEDGITIPLEIKILIRCTSL